VVMPTSNQTNSSPRLSAITLLPHHLEHLHASAISDEVLAGTGYFSATKSADLVGYGWRTSRRVKLLLPALAIPVRGAASGPGFVDYAILRPDTPVPLNGKGPKYAAPPKSTPRLDVHPSQRHFLLDPTIRLWMIEGVKKRDALVSVDEFAISIAGVWGWKGAGALTDLDAIALRGREVVIGFDSDTWRKRIVWKAARRFGELLARKGATVRFLVLEDDGTAKVGIDDFLASSGTLADLEVRVHDDLPECAEPEGLPVIMSNHRQMRDVSDEAIASLVAANQPPFLFIRGNALFRQVADKETGAPILQAVSSPALRGHLARTANWQRITLNGLVDVPPPNEIVEDILALPELPLPPLLGLIEAPVMRPNGSVLDQPGYDVATHLLYVPARGLNVTVPMSPSAAEVNAAQKLLLDLIGDFPFDSEASRANALGELLTPILRPTIIVGCVPLGLHDAPQAGTGKGLLADVTGTIATGRELSKGTPPHTEEEWRKYITASLVRGSSVIVFDNVDSALSSAALSSVLTTGEHTDRILGVSKMVTLPQKVTFIATGNNIRLGGDLARRCYRIRLDARMSRPWQRAGWRHPELLVWTRENRGRLLGALLTLARAWFAAGRPAATTPIIGGFEDWSQNVGGVLAHAGVKGFLGNLDVLYDDADEEGRQWEGFLVAWHEHFRGSMFVSTSQLTDAIRTNRALRDAVPDDLAEDLGREHTFVRRLGRALSSRVDKRFGDGGLHIKKKDDTHSGQPRWSVQDPANPA
jgi:hypothetical protein